MSKPAKRQIGAYQHQFDIANLFNVITNIDPAITQVLTDTAAQNPRVPVANSVPVLRTVADGDFLSPDQHRHHPFYREVCSPWDVPYICLTAVDRTDDMSVIWAASRARENGQSTSEQRSIFTHLAHHVQSAVRLHMAIERNNRLPSTNRRPSRISRPRWRSGLRSGFGGRDLIDPTHAADQRKLSASMSTA